MPSHYVAMTIKMTKTHRQQAIKGMACICWKRMVVHLYVYFITNHFYVMYLKRRCLISSRNCVESRTKVTALFIEIRHNHRRMKCRQIALWGRHRRSLTVRMWRRNKWAYFVNQGQLINSWAHCSIENHITTYNHIINNC